MSLRKASSFPWDSMLNKVGSPDVKKLLNSVRGKANDIAINSERYVKTPAPIDFEAYKKKLKLTGTAVEKLEKIYKSRKLPTYHATLPAFVAKKRAAVQSVLQTCITAAEEDLKLCEEQLKAFETVRITRDTTVGDLNKRFPAAAREIDDEISKHQWYAKIDDSSGHHLPHHH